MQVSLNLQMVAEACFTNPLVVAMTQLAAANGDEVTPTMFLSIQSDELRHMANGYHTIVSVVDDPENMQYLQTEQLTDFRRALLNPEFDTAGVLLEERRTPLSFANPYGSRISEYEQVLLYTQPNPDWIPGGIGVGGWAAAFAGGRGAWENYFTELRISDWFVFRDPEGRWKRPYGRKKPTNGAKFGGSSRPRRRAEITVRSTASGYPRC